MPERIFKYKTTEDLIVGVRELGDLLASGTGPTNALRNSSTGFLVQTGAVSQQQIRNYFMMGRYEIYLRGQGVDGNPPDDQCAQLEATDPFQEKRMKVHSSFQKWPAGYGGWGSIF